MPSGGHGSDTEGPNEWGRRIHVGGPVERPNSRQFDAELLTVERGVPKSVIDLFLLLVDSVIVLQACPSSAIRTPNMRYHPMLARMSEWRK